MRRRLGALLLFVAAAACAAAAPEAPPPPQVSAAELALGERVYRRCYGCHALEPGRNSPAGPSLHAIVGKPIASEAGFNYSPALRRFAEHNGRWFPALLDAFLADPAAIAPGTEMGFPGLPDGAERRALILWLESRRTGGES
jgi:cytochrome c